MSTGRVYLSCISSETGRDVLPWAGLVIASLMLSEKPMRIKDICLDIAQGRTEIAKSIYANVYERTNKLIDIGWLLQRPGQLYVVSSKGRKSFTPFMDRVSQNSWKSISDSRILNG